VAKEFIPFPFNFSVIFFYELFDLPQLLRRKSNVDGQTNRLNPKLCHVVVTQDVDMDRLIPI